MNRIFNLAARMDEDGKECLDLNVIGVIGGGWLDAESTSVAEMAAMLQEHPTAAEIVVHINSEGGSLFDGIALYNLLQGHGAKITSRVEGLAASAASIVAMAGRTVMGRGAMLMIHNPLAIVAGDAHELRQQAAVLDKAQASLIAIYKAKTGKDGADLRAMLNAETWMDAEQAVRQGFADEIASDEIAVEESGDEVLVNTVSFKRQSLPTQILNLAKPAACIPQAPADDPEPPKGEPETVGVEPSPVVEPPPALLPTGDEPEQPTAPAPIENRATASPSPSLTRDMLPAALVEELLAEGHARGVAAERARIQAIDALPTHGCAELAIEAKYGQPATAAELAVAILASDQRKREEMLAKRRAESTGVADIRPNTPNQTDRASDESRAVAAMTAAINARRGGSR